LKAPPLFKHPLKEGEIAETMDVKGKRGGGREDREEGVREG